MPRADQATIDLLTDYFQAMEVKDFDRLGAYYADEERRVGRAWAFARWWAGLGANRFAPNFRPRWSLELSVLEQLHGKFGGHHQDRSVDDLQVLGEICLRENLDDS